MTKKLILILLGIFIFQIGNAQKNAILNSKYFQSSSSPIISPDGKFFATNTSKSITIWDVKTAREIKTFTSNKYLTSRILFTQDSKSIIYAGHEFIKIIDIYSGQELKSFTTPVNNFNIAYNSNFTTLLSCTGKDIILWDVETTKQLKILKKHESYVTAADFSPNDKIIVSGSQDGSVIIWEVSNSKIIKEFNLNSPVKDIKCSPDGKYFAVTNNETIKLYSLNSFEELALFEHSKRNYANYITSVSFNKNSKYILSSRYNESILWDIEKKMEYRYIKGSNGFFHSNGKTFYALTPLRKFDINSETIDTLECNIFTKDYNVTSNIKSFLYDHENKIILYSYSTSSPQGVSEHTSIYNAMDNSTVTVDGSYIVNSFQKSSFLVEIDNSIIEYNIKGEKLNRFNKNDNWGETLNASLDGRYIATTTLISNERVLSLWHSKNGKKYKDLYGFNCKPYKAVFSENNKFIVGQSGVGHNCEGWSQIWDIKTGKKLSYFKDEFFTQISISEDENYITASGKTITKVWDTKNGQLIKTIPDFDESSHFIKKSKYDIKLSWSKFIFSDNEKNKQLAALVLIPNTNDWIVTTPDGRFDGTEKGMELLHYVENMSIIPLSSLYEQYYTPNLLARILSGEEFEEPEIKVDDLTLPPLVEITSPKEQGDLRGFKPVNTGGLKSASQQIEVTVQATDQSGGIDEIRLFVNGKLVETTQRGFKPVVQNNQTKTQTFTISLSNGKNIIKATAFNNQRTESIADEIIVYYEGAKATSDLYLFVIGIDKYRNPDMNLNYAVADATGFKDAIVGNTSTIFGSVNTSFITNESATKEKILAEFETIKAKMKQEDVLIFYYAGHGAMSIENNPLYYLVLYDVHQLYGNNDLLNNKALSVEEIKNICMELPAQKQLFVLDACQSGGVEKAVMRGNAEQKAIAVLSRATGTYWLTASGTDEYATEFEQLKHGVFTYAILQGLKGEADAGNKDKQITVKELDFYIQDKVPELSEKYKGQPQFPKSYGGGDDFPLIIIK